MYVGPPPVQPLAPVLSVNVPSSTGSSPGVVGKPIVGATFGSMGSLNSTVTSKNDPSAASVTGFGVAVIPGGSTTTNGSSSSFAIVPSAESGVPTPYAVPLATVSTTVSSGSTLPSSVGSTVTNAVDSPRPNVTVPEVRSKLTAPVCV